MSSMEKDLRIALDQKYAVYGRLNGPLTKPLVIVVHGLPGDIYDSFCASATKWFSRHDFSAFRFNLYGYQKDARRGGQAPMGSLNREFPGTVEDHRCGERSTRTRCQAISQTRPNPKESHHHQRRDPLF